MMGAQEVCLMIQDIKNMPILDYKKLQEDEEDKNMAKKCRFIDDEAE